MNKRTKKLNRLNGGDQTIQLNGPPGETNTNTNSRSLKNRVSAAASKAASRVSEFASGVSTAASEVSEFAQKAADATKFGTEWVAEAPGRAAKAVVEGIEVGDVKLGIEPTIDILGDIKDKAVDTVRDSTTLKKGISNLDKIVDRTTGIGTDMFTQDSRCKFDIEGAKTETKDQSNVENKLSKSLLFSDDEKFKKFMDERIINKCNEYHDVQNKQPDEYFMRFFNHCTNFFNCFEDVADLVFLFYDVTKSDLSFLKIIQTEKNEKKQEQEIELRLEEKLKQKDILEKEQKEREELDKQIAESEEDTKKRQAEEKKEQNKIDTLVKSKQEKLEKLEEKEKIYLKKIKDLNRQITDKSSEVNQSIKNNYIETINEVIQSESNKLKYKNIIQDSNRKRIGDKQKEQKINALVNVSIEDIIKNLEKKLEKMVSEVTKEERKTNEDIKIKMAKFIILYNYTQGELNDIKGKDGFRLSSLKKIVKDLYKKSPLIIIENLETKKGELLETIIKNLETKKEKLTEDELKKKKEELTKDELKKKKKELEKDLKELEKDQEKEKKELETKKEELEKNLEAINELIEIFGKIDVYTKDKETLAIISKLYELMNMPEDSDDSSSTESDEDKLKKLTGREYKEELESGNTNLSKYVYVSQVEKDFLNGFKNKEDPNEPENYEYDYSKISLAALEYKLKNYPDDTKLKREIRKKEEEIKKLEKKINKYFNPEIAEQKINIFVFFLNNIFIANVKEYAILNSSTEFKFKDDLSRELSKILEYNKYKEQIEKMDRDSEFREKLNKIGDTSFIDKKMFNTIKMDKGKPVFIMNELHKMLKTNNEVKKNIYDYYTLKMQFEIDMEDGKIKMDKKFEKDKFGPNMYMYIVLGFLGTALGFEYMNYNNVQNAME